MWGEEFNNMIMEWIRYISHLPADFIISPIIREKEDAEFKEAMHHLKKYPRIHFLPTLIKTSSTQFRSILNFRTALKDFFSLLKTFIQAKPDVIICFYITHAYPLVFLKKLFGFSLWSYAMGDDVNLNNSLFDKLAKKLVYASSDKVFAVAEDLKVKIEKVHKGKVTVIPFGADTKFFRPLNEKLTLRQKWGFNPEDFVIFTACRLDKRKGVDLLIKSLTELQHNGAKLIIAGVGEEADSLKSLALQLKVHKKIRFLGFRTKRELLELYNIADLFVIASYSEGLPRVLIEAMACECICIATDVGDVSKVIVDGYNGFLIRSEDQEELSEIIKHVTSLSDKDIKRIRSKTRFTILENFDNEKLVNKIFEKTICQ